MVADKYQNKCRVPSARLQTWDYASNAAYFITICTAKRKHYFGDIIEGAMNLSEQGKFAGQYWLEIADHFSFVFLDEFVVMPNHVHGIIIIDNPENDGIEKNNNDLIIREPVETGHAVSLLRPHPRFRNQGKNTISAMVGSYKSAVTKGCNKHDLPFGWQPRFHDHIIRDNEAFNRIKNYIINNPAKWEEDKFLKPGI